MGELEEIQIDGNPFFLKKELATVVPIREEPKPHMCVCLLIMQRVSGGLVQIIKDKCHALVDNPDQPFCEHCEDAEHPSRPNQKGQARQGRE